MADDVDGPHPLEIEIKAHAKDLDALEKALRAQGAVLKHDWHEMSDIYLNHPDRDFAMTDEALRLRMIKARAILTYKGPKVDGHTKTRREVEVDVKGDILLLLHDLGFRPVRKVEKRRKVYLLHDCEVCLDDVKDLGTFVEIEAKMDDLDEGRQRLMQIASELGLMEFERRSYLELLLEKDL